MRYDVVGVLICMFLVCDPCLAHGANGKRVHCESNDDAYPFVDFDFFPYDRDVDDYMGAVVMRVDRGQILDVTSYNNVDLTWDESSFFIIYKDGILEFEFDGEFDRPGSVKHISGSGAFKKDLLCYKN